MNSIIKLDLPENCRIIAVSDIHTCCDLLDTMLKKVKYNPDKDYLVIVGDILEHWSNNINTLKYVYKLSRNDKVYCLLGNNDTFSARMAFSYPYERFAEKFYISKYGIDNAFLQMAKSVGYDYCTEENWLDIRKAVLSETTGKNGKGKPKYEVHLRRYTKESMGLSPSKPEYDAEGNLPKGFRFHQYLLGERFSFTFSACFWHSITSG